MDGVEAIQERCIHIEKINGPMLFNEGASPAEYWAGLQYAIDNDWMWLHQSGPFLNFAPAGATERALSKAAILCESGTHEAFRRCVSV